MVCGRARGGGEGDTKQHSVCVGRRRYTADNPVRLCRAVVAAAAHHLSHQGFEARESDIDNAGLRSEGAKTAWGLGPICFQCVCVS